MWCAIRWLRVSWPPMAGPTTPGRARRSGMGPRSCGSGRLPRADARAAPAGMVDGGAEASGAGISVILAAPGWRAAAPGAERLARRAAAAALREAGCGAGAAVTVLLTDDRDLRRLNGRHRRSEEHTSELQ